MLAYFVVTLEWIKWKRNQLQKVHFNKTRAKLCNELLPPFFSYHFPSPHSGNWLVASWRATRVAAPSTDANPPSAEVWLERRARNAGVAAFDPSHRFYPFNIDHHFPWPPLFPPSPSEKAERRQKLSLSGDGNLEKIELHFAVLSGVNYIDISIR